MMFWNLRKNRFSTIGITDDGSPNRKLLGMVTGRITELTGMLGKVKFYDTFSKHLGKFGIALDEANDIIWDNKINALPIIDKHQNLKYFVFRKDYDSHRTIRMVTDSHKH